MAMVGLDARGPGSKLAGLTFLGMPRDFPASCSAMGARRFSLCHAGLLRALTCAPTGCGLLQLFSRFHQFRDVANDP